jgi:hypothetical protein
VPFVRVSRDKRGYETIYLVHTSQRRGRPPATRVLYAFRTPPGIRVGREPFDAEVRRTVEAQNPGVEFDWPRLSNIPAPPPDVEHWRERRRAEKAAKQARREEELEEAADADQPEPEIDSPDDSARPPVELEISGAREEDSVPADGLSATPADAPVDAAPVVASQAAGAARQGKRRRRRRGGRRSLLPGPPGAPVSPAPAGDPALAQASAADLPPAQRDPGDDGEDVA